MHYTALHNYSVAAGRPPVPAQKAPAMAAFTAIAASSGELMVPENAGVVIQAKSGINAIRVSGTATTTAGLTGPGTTANQIQFYSNDTIVGAFDKGGLYSYGITALSTINSVSSELWPVNITRTGASAAYGVGIDFKLTGSVNTFSYARLLGGWLSGSTEGTKGYFAIDAVSNSNFPGNSVTSSLIYGDWTSGVTVNSNLTVTSSISSNLYKNNGNNNLVINSHAGIGTNASISFSTTSSNNNSLSGSWGYINAQGWSFLNGSSSSSPTILCGINSTGFYLHSAGYFVNGATFNQVNSVNTFANTDMVLWNNAGGNIAFTTLGTGTVYSNGGKLTNLNPSDMTLKTNINPINSQLDNIIKMKPVTYNWIDTVRGTDLNYGFIAQDLQQIPDISNLVKSFKDGDIEKLGYDPISLIRFIIKAMQEQQDIINNLQKQIDRKF